MLVDARPLSRQSHLPAKCQGSEAACLQTRGRAPNTKPRPRPQKKTGVRQRPVRSTLNAGSGRLQ